LVVEAAERSGSLITARLAGEIGREVLAIPGSIHSPLAKGCHRLIKQGAKLVESAQDALEELRWTSVSAQQQNKTTASFSSNSGKNDEDALAEPDSASSLITVMGYDPVSVDVLATRSGLTADTLLAILLALELEGRVAQLPGGLYQQLAYKGRPND
jgi:DNA processing protein